MVGGWWVRLIADSALHSSGTNDSSSALQGSLILGLLHTVLYQIEPSMCQLALAV